ncbi:MAG: lipid-binding SYLF domain-containing protein [Terriglobia bacterium]|jgi:lipid-binding SYLF domain-containing protein
MRKLMSIVLWLTFLGTALATGQSHEAKRLESAAFVLNEIMQTPEQGIPRDLLNKAVCVGVIPSELRFAFGFGGSYGRGALACRKGGDGSWGAPSMFTMYGVNFGFQIGGKATDIVFIVMNSGGVRKLVQSGVKLGVDASAAAGPVGRTAEGATDLQLHAEILSYSRSRGLFAGVSLAGAVLKTDYGANFQLYRHVYEPKEILIDGLATPPAEAKQLDDILAQYSPRGGEPFPKA